MQAPAFPEPEPLLRGGIPDLVSALDGYEATSTLLVEHWLDMDLYAQFSSQIEAIRGHVPGIPALTVLSLQLAIAHAELASTLWQNACTGVSAAKMQEARERHRLAIHAFRAVAARLPMDV